MRSQSWMAVVLFLSFRVIGWSEEATTYDGVWRTTNRKLDGTMTCVVKELGNEKWQGRFYGNWQGTFTGPSSNFRGTAVIDGASYTWTGEILPDSSSFTGKFRGSRYAGFFDLKRKKSVAR